MNYNEVTLSGKINNILINNKYVTIGLTCKKYSPDEKNNIVYASLKVYKDLYDKNIDFFILGKIIYIKGYLNSYSDKKKIIHNYVTVTKIENYDFINSTGPVIERDYDGVMLWNGKRCESIPPTKEEKDEMERLINEVIGGK